MNNEQMNKMNKLKTRRASQQGGWVAVNTLTY